MKELTRLASAIERHTTGAGLCETAVPGLALYRYSAPSPHDDTVYEPSLCVSAQGAKEVLLGNEMYRYDPTQSLLARHAVWRIGVAGNLESTLHARGRPSKLSPVT